MAYPSSCFLPFFLPPPSSLSRENMITQLPAPTLMPSPPWETLSLWNPESIADILARVVFVGVLYHSNREETNTLGHPKREEADLAHSTGSTGHDAGTILSDKDLEGGSITWCWSVSRSKESRCQTGSQTVIQKLLRQHSRKNRITRELPVA